MKFSTLSLAAILFLVAFGINIPMCSQTVSEESVNVTREVIETSEGTIIYYSIEGVSLTKFNTGKMVYDLLHLKGFGQSLEPGRPSIPTRTEKIALPYGVKEPEIIVKAGSFTDYGGMHLMPSQMMPGDGGNKNLPFVVDENFYNMNEFSPAKMAELVDIQHFKGQALAYVRVQPVQYNPAQRILRVYSDIEVTVRYPTFSKAGTNIPSVSAQNLLGNIVLNKNSVQQKPTFAKSVSTLSDAEGYIILTTDEFLEAADSLAAWKNQMGYKVHIISKASWASAAEAKTEIKNLYNSLYPKPSYLAVLGDQEDVPDGFYRNPYLADVLDVWTTNYFACMDGERDYLPEMAHGRIPVYSAKSAMSVVRKLIEYERNPSTNPDFYRKGIHAGYFQDSTRNGVADKRYAHSNIDMYNYFTDLGFSSDLILYTEPDVYPQRFNSYYSGNTPFPEEYKKENGYAWEGDKHDIIDALNEGRLYAFHRDHGLQKGWMAPQIDTADLNGLHNGKDTPIVFSINCGSGSFHKPHPDMCFAEKLLRYENGGAIGIVAATEETRSGYNDAFIMGMVDAIWPNPGLLADFGTKKEEYTDTEFTPVYTMGDVMIQGLIRMQETYDPSGWADQDHFHLYHYFGDPAMKVWTAMPEKITAEHNQTIAKGMTSIQVSNVNCENAWVTLVYDDQIQSKKQLSGTSGTINLPAPLPANIDEIKLTIYSHNYIPYEAKLGSDSQLQAYFNVSASGFCAEDTIQLTDVSINNPESWEWSITPTNYMLVGGTDLNSQNPIIKPLSAESYSIKLIVANAEALDSITRIDVIKPLPSPQAPIAEGGKFCDSIQAILAASGSNGIYQWYDSPQRTNLLSEGELFSTPLLRGSTSYYVGVGNSLSQANLATTWESTNNAGGNMFDITAKENIIIDSLHINISDTEMHQVKLYYKDGSYDGYENNASAWTLWGTYSVQSQGPNNPTLLPARGLEIMAGSTTGLYITLADGNLKYTWGGAEYENDDIKIVTGAGIDYPFSTIYEPRTWNGEVFYSKGEYGCASPLTEVTIQIIETPEAPSANGYSICYNDSIRLLKSLGENVKWFTDEELSNLVAEGDSFKPDRLNVGENSWYITSETDDCMSEAENVSVIRYPLTPNPVIEDAVICQYDTAKISASGENIVWLDMNDQRQLKDDGRTIIHIGGDPGIYSYRVNNTMNGCSSDSVLAYVEVLAKPEIQLVDDIEICYGDSVSLEIAGEGTYWHDITKDSISKGNIYTMNAPDPGSYSFKVFQFTSGCWSDTLDVEVVVFENPVFTLGNDTTIYSTDSLEFVRSEFGSFEWSNGETGNSLLVLAEEFGVGTHQLSLRYTDENNCETNDSITISVIQKPDGLGEMLFTHTFIYPNPSEGIVNVEFGNPSGLEVYVQILDSTGRLIESFTTRKSKASIDLTDQPAGIYHLIFESGNQRETYKIMLN